MKRTIILLMDSFGLGGARDAHKFIGQRADGSEYNDVGSDTINSKLFLLCQRIMTLHSEDP